MTGAWAALLMVLASMLVGASVGLHVATGLRWASAARVLGGATLATGLAWLATLALIVVVTSE